MIFRLFDQFINVREYRGGNQTTDNPEKLATRRRKTKQKHNAICVEHYYTQANKI